MVYTWRITFELRGIYSTPAPTDSMIVRAPTAEDALTMFRVKLAPADFKVLGMSLYEAIGPVVPHCPICQRRWEDHLSERGTCIFRHGWVLERQLDDVERERLGLAPRLEPG